MMQQLKHHDNARNMCRINYNEESDEDVSEGDAEQLVSRVDGEGCKPFYMEGMICGNYFKAIIDTGSPVSIFTEIWNNRERKGSNKSHDRGRTLRRLQQEATAVIGLLISTTWSSGRNCIKSQSISCANSGKSTVGRDWLVALRYKITQPIEIGEWKVKQNLNCKEPIWDKSRKKAKSLGSAISGRISKIVWEKRPFWN